eukprot:352209_1
MDTLSDSVLIKIIAFNLHHNDFTNAKRLNKEFYKLLNPNEFAVNKLWESITRHNYPLVPLKLKCKRWDLYYKYRMKKIKRNEKTNWEHGEALSMVKPQTDKPFVNVIENC